MALESANEPKASSSKTVQMTIRYSPSNLQDSELDVLSEVLHNDKAKKIVIILSNNKSMYLNEIQSAVGGSKTATVEVLKDLEKKFVISSSWYIKEITTDGGPKKRAVRVFRLNETNKTLLENYKPLVEKGIIF